MWSLNPHFQNKQSKNNSLRQNQCNVSKKKSYDFLTMIFFLAQYFRIKEKYINIYVCIIVSVCVIFQFVAEFLRVRFDNFETIVGGEMRPINSQLKSLYRKGGNSG